MNTVFKFSSLFFGMLFAFSAMGGTSIGGGVFGKTKLLLQSFAHSEAILTLPGDTTNIPETDTTPRIEIPADEYKDFVDEACKLEAPEDEPFLTLSSDPVDGSVRNYNFYFIGKPCKEPFVLFLEVTKAETENSVE